MNIWKKLIEKRRPLDDVPINGSMPDTDDDRFIRYGLIVLVGVFGVLGTWMAFAPLQSAAVAVGKVSVEGKNKTIQHFEGGIVKDIHVTDGDHVDEGDVLLSLDTTRAQAELGTVLSQYYETLALESRLLTERDRLSAIKFDDELSSLEESRKKAFIDGQRRLFDSRRQALESEKEIMSKRISQLNNQIEGNQAIIDSKTSRLLSYQEEIKEWQVLYEEQLTDKLKLRELQRDSETIIGDIAQHQAEIAGLNVKINETESQILLQEQEFTKEVVSQLREAQTSLANMRSQLLSLRDTLKRTDIIAPVEGTVVGLDAHTIGGVIAAGKTILEIVPDGNEMIIYAQVQTTDIDKVTVGLDAEVRFSAFNLKMAYVVEGKVINVSADSFVNEVSGLPYYEAQIRLEDTGHRQLEENGFFLLTGMPAEVIIKTGERTVLSYLMKPISDMFSRTFRED